MPARSAMGTVAYNGYMYVLGGVATAATGDCNNTGDYCNGVWYATISSGIIGSWTPTTSFTGGAVMAPRSSFSTVVYNGYLYVIGGKGAASTGDCNSSGLCPGVFDALICTGSNSGTGGCGATAGTIGSWTVTTAFTGGATMPYRYDFGATAYNGYLYVSGGHGTASTGDCNSTGQCSGDYYAPFDSDGSIGSWTSTTAFTGGAVMPARYGLSTVAYNGYLYVLGGIAGSSTGDCTYGTDFCKGVFYALICTGSNSGSDGCGATSGTIGSWIATTKFPDTLPNMPARAYFGVSISNGYLYVSGGQGHISSADCTATTNFCNGIYYVPLFANGTIGTWSQSGTFLASTTMPARDYLKTVIYNGYLFVLGGLASASSGDCTATSDACKGVFYAQILTAGNIDPNWYASANALSQETLMGVVAWNGYLYEVGGGYSSVETNTTEDAQINANGTLGSWSAQTTLVTAVDVAATVVYNGWIYVIGGCTNGGGCNANVQSAQINATTGALGTWANNTAVTVANGILDDVAAVAYNGYIYVMGGCDGNHGCGTEAVYYDSIGSNGTLGTWAAYANTATGSLQTGVIQAGAVVDDGYIYVTGGCSSTCPTTTVQYAKIDQTNGKLDIAGSGTCGAGNIWCTTSSLYAAAQETFSVAVNGYIYMIAGYTTGGSNMATNQFAPINSNGTLGAWATTSPLPYSLGLMNGAYWNGFIYLIGGNPGNEVLYTQVNNGGPGTVSAWTTSPNNLASPTALAATAVYNGYVYEIGGCANAACPSLTVYYASINSNGGIGAWQSTTSLGTATSQLSAVADNGYLYELGGLTGSGNSTAVYYASINSNGTINAWQPTTVLLNANTGSGTVVYNGYIYEVGGCNTTCPATEVDYALICTGSNSGTGGCGATAGTIGTWHTTSSLLTAADWAGVTESNGYLYSVGGCGSVGACGSSTTNMVEYAAINSNGTLGSWSSTSSLYTGTGEIGAVVDDGYLYELAGVTSSGNSAVVGEAAINTNGSLGNWAYTTSVPNAVQEQTVMTYDGYVYQIGGVVSGTNTATTNYAALNSIPRVGNYSMLVNLGNGLNVTPAAIIITGTNTGNPGTGGLSGLGGMNIQYENGTATCSVLSPPTTVKLGPQEMATAYNLLFTNDGCSHITNQGVYAWVHFNLDDSLTASYPDSLGNHTTVTAFQIYYHAADSARLRGGLTLQNGIQQSLDAPPSTTQ